MYTYINSHNKRMCTYIFIDFVCIHLSFLCAIILLFGGDFEVISEARLKANKKYQSKFDDIKIRVPAGQREMIKAYAEKQGKSLNGYINDLINADIERYKKETFSSDDD